MKILTVDKIREADAYTIKHEPIESLNLMERAGINCFKWIFDRLAEDQKVMVYAGPGNNGGDGLVIGRLLAERNVEVEVVLLKFSDKLSADCKANLERLQEQGKAKITEAKADDDIPVPDGDDLVIDAIFGSGLGRPAEKMPATAINKMNASGAVIVAVDIPSGMFADKITDEKEGAVVHADYTLSLELPKLAMMIPEAEIFVGELIVIPIGLHHDFLTKVDTDYHVTTSHISSILPVRSRFSHKGHFGHVLVIAGSYGKMGACVLTSKAVLRSGAGLVTAHVPSKGYNVIQTALPECMAIIDDDPEIQTNIPKLDEFDVVAVGPGLGTAEPTQKMLKILIQEFSRPIVLDADALNILAENPTWLSFLPSNSILTPHPGEFDRLAGKSNNHLERIEKAREFAKKHSIYLVLKGGITAVCTPQGKAWFNTTGNPGMATAGSGDTLTGIIAGILALGFSPFDTSRLAVFLHGLAGDIAAERLGEEAMIASDITDCLPDAFFEMME